MTIREYIPYAKDLFIKGAAMGAYLVEVMKDLRIYDPSKDPTITYKAELIAPEIKPLLDKARKRRGQVWITEKGIDLIIERQTKDIEEAKRYIRWKYLGELTYKQAFIEPKEDIENVNESDIKKDIIELKAEIKALTKAIEDLRNTILMAN